MAVGVATTAAHAAPTRPEVAAASGCSLGSDIKHVIYLQFDNVHYTRDNRGRPGHRENGQAHPVRGRSGGDEAAAHDHQRPEAHGHGGAVREHDFWLSGGSASCGTSCVSEPADGDVAPEINTTWLGLVGPDVRHEGVDNSLWSDHTDIQPTMMGLLGAAFGGHRLNTREARGVIQSGAGLLAQAADLARWRTSPGAG
jgi:hypothetical protein